MNIYHVLQWELLTKKKGVWIDGGWWRVHFRWGSLAEDETPRKDLNEMRGEPLPNEDEWWVTILPKGRTNNEGTDFRWLSLCDLWVGEGFIGAEKEGGLPSIPWSAPPQAHDFVSEVAQCPLWLEIVQPGDGGESAGEVKVSEPERRHSTWSRMPAASWTSSSAQERGRHHFPELLDQNQLTLEPWVWAVGFCHLALGNGSAARTDCAASPSGQPCQHACQDTTSVQGHLPNWTHLHSAPFCRKELQT